MQNMKKLENFIVISVSLFQKISVLCSCFTTQETNYNSEVYFCYFSACNLPDKITVYSTLVGLLNVKNYTCGEQVQ